MIAIIVLSVDYWAISDHEKE